ncbi:MAG TPA: NAD-dependent epimerase/dehydratase family protein [Candidatus Gallacutalibacter stercoravium]|nr:NAD-dependent epimerase/dehydratase family protein [Candidatus Gallacutalibacter stercoravium]
MFLGNLYDDDLNYAADGLPCELFDKKSVLVTGATGMIGSCIVDILLKMVSKYQLDISIFATGRSLERLNKRFDYALNIPNLHFLEMDLASASISDFSADFIIHAASSADPVSFAKEPVNIMMANILGTKNLIETGRRNHLQRFVYISSGEIYGQPNETMDDFVESYSGFLDYSSPRSCYPSAKRATEVLCQSYISQYDLDCVIARPCHIFGPTLTTSDSRAASEFIRSAANGKDIVLKSAGLVERSHCYVVDAAQAILFLLIHGEKGQAYNISDTKYQMTIRDFAQQAANAGNCQLIFSNPSDLEQKGYSKITRQVLSAGKIKNLGWEPRLSPTSNIAKSVDILKLAQTQA